MKNTDPKLNTPYASGSGKPSKLARFASDHGPALIALAVIVAVWQLVCSVGLVPPYMLPSPVAVVKAFIKDFDLLMGHAAVTIQEAFYGLVIGTVLGFLFAVFMDMFDIVRRSIYPILVVTQTIPTVSIAPLLVLWFGYEMKPKIILIVLATFFPITVGLLGGFATVDRDSVALLKSMGAGKWKIFRYIKFPSALPEFFSGLKIAAAYAIVSAVISEWLGGFNGLGVYMTRVKKAYAFDKMFAVIILISVVSLLLMLVVNIAEKKCMPYRDFDKRS